MKNSNEIGKITARLLGIAATIGLVATAAAATPVVKIVPWDPANPNKPHDTYSGKLITLKGTSDQSGGSWQWIWDFGDGSSTASYTVTDKYVIQATHSYSGAVGTVYQARLTVTNTATGESADKVSCVRIQPDTLNLEANIAMDEGLWYLHKSEYRYTSGGMTYGDWTQSLYGGYAAYSIYAVSAINLNAFEANGHLETGSSDDPYVETVQRAMRSLFSWLTTISVPLQNNPMGTFNPDGNGNGLGIQVNQPGQEPYFQGGMFMDAIIASGTPNTVTVTGATNVIGRTYKDIIQDMVDAHAYAQYDSSPQGGGWSYDANQTPRNSAGLWVAQGLIPAERQWNCLVPAEVKNWNIVWLNYSQDPNTGYFGYIDKNPVWGPYATTPAGLLQLAMDGKGRGTVLPGQSQSSWDLAETFLCNNFNNTGGAGNSIKSYYEGLYTFTKAMLLHANDSGPMPIVWLQSQTPGVNAIDWYGDPVNGVARRLVNDQSPDGYWYGHNYYSLQFPLETAMAIMMLRHTSTPDTVTTAATEVAYNSARLNGTVNPNGQAAILWFEWGSTTNYGNATPSTNAGSGTVPVPLSQWLTNLTPSVTYHYRAVGSNSAGLEWGQDTTFNLYLAPSIINQPQNQQTVLSSNVSFNVLVTGQPPFSYQWYFSNTNFQTGAGACAQMLAGFIYGAVVTNGGSGYTLVPQVRIVGGGGSGAGGYAAVSNGMVAAITMTNAGSGYTSLPAVQIDPPNGLLAGQTNDTLNLTAVTRNDIGNYFVVVSNAYGSVTSSMAALTLLLPPVIVQPPQNANSPMGGNAQFEVSVSGPAPYHYQWWMVSGVQSNAIAVPVVINGFVLEANITSGGAGYLAVPNVRIVGGSGSGAGGYATVSNRMVSAITMTNAGSGYTTPPIIQVDPPTAISLPGQTNATLTLLAVTNGNAANYFVVVANDYGSVTSAVATLAVFLPPRGFTCFKVQKNQLTLQFTGTPNYPYLLQSTTNLAPPINWQPVLTNPADLNGNWQFTDTNLNTRQKFYRAGG